MFEHILRSAAKGPIDVQSRQDASERGIYVWSFAVRVYADDLGSNVFLHSQFAIEVTAYSASQGFCEISLATNVDREVVFLWSAGKSERVVLPD